MNHDKYQQGQSISNSEFVPTDEFGRRLKRSNPVDPLECTVQPTRGKSKGKKKKTGTLVLCTNNFPYSEYGASRLAPYYSNITSSPHQAHIYVKPLIVLDLNGILCHRVRDFTTHPSIIATAMQLNGHNREIISTAALQNDRGTPQHQQTMPTTTISHSMKMIHQNLYRPSAAHIAGTPIIYRTDLVSFLTMLDQNFTLAVWTSAKRKTARLLVKA